MSFDRLQKWDGREVCLLRLDYGYTPQDLGVSYARAQLVDAIDWALQPRPAEPGTQTVVTSADRLVGLRRRKHGLGWLERLVSADGGLLLVARFPRMAERLSQLLKNRGISFDFLSVEAQGELPPLYRRTGVDTEVGRLHLLVEWETGLAVARGSTVLREAGALMAASGGCTAGELSAALGTTAGAARSYLAWMAEAGLARRGEGGRSLLRHPGLERLFREAAPPPAPPLVPVPPRPAEPRPTERPAPRRWDPSELD